MSKATCNKWNTFSSCSWPLFPSVVYILLKELLPKVSKFKFIIQEWSTIQSKSWDRLMAELIRDLQVFAEDGSRWHVCKWRKHGQSHNRCCKLLDNTTSNLKQALTHLVTLVNCADWNFHICSSLIATCFYFYNSPSQIRQKSSLIVFDWYIFSQ